VSNASKSVDQTAEKKIAADKLSILKSYVYSKDDAFEYKKVDEIKGKGYTTYVIRMVSQRWMTTKEVKDPTWWHWLTLVVPDEVKTNTGMLIISGGNRNSKQPKKADQLVLQTALATQSVVVNLHNVPNQPTEFVGDDFGGRYEDEIIAYGWNKFMEMGSKRENAQWLARLPMTKAAVRALDVITDFTAKNTSKKVDNFVVAGGSKRGWTTWTTGAVDDRVVAIIPIVIDMLNTVPSFQHHWRAYGYWAPAVNDYVREGVMEWQGSKEYNQLLDLTEPYSFKSLLTLPKLLLNATGDQFFLPDSWRFYWKDLQGEKLMRYVPNSEHSMRKTDIIETIIAFYQMIIMKKERPTFDWEIKDGHFLVKTNNDFAPTALTLWQAHNPKARNFQVDSIGRAYQASPIPLATDGQYKIAIPKAAQGYTASFVELTFPGLSEKAPLKLTTGVTVSPDIYEHAPFESTKPKGTFIKAGQR
jgi:PhoPQ-activated pathogenicity-related protein